MPPTNETTTHSTVLQTVNVPEFSPANETWNIWKEKLEIHFSEINCTAEAAKRTILLKSIGTTAYTLLHTLCSPSSPVSKDLNELYGILATHFSPPTIVFRERKNFHSAVKSNDETIAEWFAKIKLLALNCNFGDSLDAFVLDKFVVGLPDRIFERFCEETETLTLANALRKAMIFETKFLSQADALDSSVNFVKGNSYGSNNKKSNWKKSGKKNNGSGNNNNNGAKKTCSHCDWRNHDSNSCKFKNSTCHSCSKVGHLASVCRSNNSINYVSDSEIKINQFNNINDSFDYSVYSVTVSGASELYSLVLELDGKQVEIACDTGAPCTIIPINLYHKLPKQKKKTETSFN